MIEKLTPQQEKDLISFREEALKFGRSIKPINRERCEAIITKFYKRINKKEPKFLYFSSPLMCVLAYGVLIGNLAHSLLTI